VTDWAADAVDDRETLTACGDVSSGVWNAAVTTNNVKYDDDAAMTGDDGNYGREFRDDSGTAGGAVFRLEAVAASNDDDNNRDFIDESRQIHRRRDGQQHHNVDSPLVDGPSSFSHDVTTSSGVRCRCVPERDDVTTCRCVSEREVVDVQSTSSQSSSLSLYEEYAQSPGSRRRQQRRRRQIVEDVGNTQSPRGASRHCRRAAAAPGGQQVRWQIF